MCRRTSRRGAARAGRLGRMTDLLERHRAVLPNWMGLYYEHPLELVSGSGSRVTDASGRTYLDFFCGILTNMLGYDVPEVRDAVQRQLATGIVHTSTLYLIRNQVELAEKLARLSGIENAKVFFTNSGTEAERDRADARHRRAPVQPGARAAQQLPRPLVRRGRDHRQRWRGRARQLAPFSVHYLHGTDRHLPAFAGLDDAEYTAACVADLRHVLTTATAGDVACLIAEPIQGVGGFTMPPDGLLGEYAAACSRERGVLFISDEVQTALGPDRRALLGHRRARRDPRHDHVRQGPRQRVRDRRGDRPRRPDGRRCPATASPRSAATRCPPPRPTRPWTTCSTTTCSATRPARHHDHQRAARGGRSRWPRSARSAARA